MILNAAENIMVGNIPVKRVYLGDEIVWENVSDLLDDTKINVVRLNQFGRRTRDFVYFDPTQSYTRFDPPIDVPAIYAAADYMYGTEDANVSFDCIIGKNAGDCLAAGGFAFDGQHPEYHHVNCNLINLIIYPSISVIPDGFCWACSSVKNIQIPDSITKIGTGAFGGCHALGKIKLPASIQTIMGGAFYNCTSLKSIEIPVSIQTIEGGAFYDSALETIRIHKPYGSISGAPWGATNANVIWDT